MDRDTRNATRASRRLRWLARGSLAAGCALTLAAWQAAQARHLRAVHADFHKEAQHLAQAVEREIDLFVNVLVSLGQLHTLSEQISARDFEEFARKGLQHQQDVLGAFGFAQRIPLDVRAVMESSEDGAALPIVEKADGPAFRSAELRPEYFPLTYQNPDDALGLPLGFDLASLPENAEAIARMRETGRPAMGAMLAAPGARDRTGFLVCAPIAADASGPPVELAGFTASVLWPQDLMNRALGKTLVRDMQVTLFDPRFGPPDAIPAGTLAFERTLAMVDQPWTFRCEAVPEYLRAHGTPLPWILLAAGLAVTALLTLQIASLAARTALVERTVQERTAELSEANRQVEEEMAERLRLENEIHEVTAREKQRIGQDLHDSLGQKLTGAVFLSRALAAQLADQPPDARESAEKINAILKDAVAQVRRTARGLSPVDVGEDGLPQALRHLAEETCDVHNIACSFRAEGAPRVASTQAATHLYHIAQEAVTNAIRHGEPRDIAIELRAEGARGLLSIDDNGRGLAADHAERAGAGLRIMRHRARTLGGTLDVTAKPGGGTRVVCVFPL